jgi:hypothetical protein
MKYERAADYMRIENSEVEMSNIYSNGSDGHFEFINSSIKPSSESNGLTITHYSSTEYSFIIKKCDITADGLIGSNTSIMIVEDSNIDANKFYVSSSTEISNSNIKTNGINQSSASNADDPLPYLKIKDSTILIEDASAENNYGINWILDNSYVSLEGSIRFYNYGFNEKAKPAVTLNNSYFYINGSVYAYGNIVINDKSYFLIDNTNDTNSKPALQCYNILHDDSVYPLDLDNKDVLLSETGDDNGVRNLIYEDGTIASSIKIVYRVKIVLKVANGTWADGTTEDKIIYKDVWDKLSSSDIPTGMISENGVDGYWSDEISLDDYLKGDLEYTYTFKEVKGVEENPVTGVFKYSFIILFIAGSLIYLYKMIKNKSLFKLN